MSWADGWRSDDDSGDGSAAATTGSSVGTRFRSAFGRDADGVSGRAKQDDWDFRTALTRPALLGIALLAASYLSVLAHVTDVVGGTEFLVFEVAAVVVAATLVAAYLDVRRAMVLSVAILGAGLLIYYLSIPESQRALVSLDSSLQDIAALLTGLSVLRLVQADIWVFAIAPAPLFASVVLALRGRYAQGVLVGGITLGFLILTGDAGTTVTLMGVVGATLAVGLGELDLRGALDAQWDTVALVLAAMIVLAASLSVVPGGSAQPVFFGESTPSLEANLVDNADSVGILGSIRLSPEVRFSVESDRVSYWRVGGYDRFTGGTWIRTGEAELYDGELPGPPGESRTVTQEVTAETPLNALPAAWRPVRISGDVRQVTQVTDQGGLRAASAVQEGESYTVVSEIPRHTPERLRNSGDDYPTEITDRYLQLPGSTPDRVGELTQEVVDDANATNAYDKAVAIERYLESEKRYSLNVKRPEGNIADAFLFEMDAGYCTYYATTMVVMLRTQGVPARFVTGYTPGERVAEDKWVVRGLDAHAWVEVYFEGVGWVAFDPTPGGPREAAENQRLTEARERDQEGVDTSETGPEEWTPTPTPTATPGETANGSEVNGTGNLPGRGITPDQGPIAGGEGSVGAPGSITPVTDTAAGGFEMPDRETLGYGFVFFLGALAAGRRFGVDRRLYRFLWLRYQPRTEPVADVERAYDRLETVLARRYRPRRHGETVADYLDSLVGTDPRVSQVGRLYELAHYRRSVSEAEADKAVRLVDSVVAETTPVLGRLRRAVGHGA